MSATKADRVLRSLNQVADLFWMDANPPMVSTPCTRKFRSVLQAIRYVMEYLPLGSRESAFIVLKHDTLLYPLIAAENEARRSRVRQGKARAKDLA
jgi:hypothetical protein